MSKTHVDHRPGNLGFTGLVVAGVVTLVGVFVSPPASAHFILQTPPSWWSQDGLGGPQKQGPCGNANPGEPAGTASGVVTPIVVSGSAPGTIAITVNETIGHPGHYRVALAQTQATLPAEPAVTAAGGDPCASAVIQPATMSATVPATMGVVLGDNLSPKTTARMGVQAFSVPIPAGLTCTNCTLQVIEFMSSHGLNVPGGCFYHHCANVSIQASAAGGSGGAGAGGRGGAGGARGTGGAPSGSGGATSNGGAKGPGSGGSGPSASGGAPSPGGSGGRVGSGGSSSGSGGSSGMAGATGTSSGGAGVDAATDSPSAPASSGCGCSLGQTHGAAGEAPFAFLVGTGVALLLLRRRRHRK